LQLTQPRLCSLFSTVFWTQQHEYNQIEKRLVSEIYKNIHLNEKGDSVEEKQNIVIYKALQRGKSEN